MEMSKFGHILITMKTQLIILVLALPMVYLAQNNQMKAVPQEVKTSFQKQYPAVEEAKWEKEGENYEVEYKQGDKELSVLYDAKGNLIETEVEIKSEELPKSAKEYIKANYKDQKIKEASQITDAKGTITYEAEIKGTDLIFDSEGKFVKEQKN